MKYPPFNIGDWVMGDDERQPLIGTVKELFEDSIEPGWLMNVVVYKHTGEKIGRQSDPQGGPTFFEPALNCNRFVGIETPKFPLELDITRGWRQACRVITKIPFLQPIPGWMFGPSVAARNALQKSGRVHPYTCGNNRSDEAHKKYQVEHPDEDLGQLIATEEGWRCPVCGYTQTWTMPTTDQ